MRRRRCTDCNKLKPPRDFYKVGGKGGERPRGECKACCLAKNQDWRNRHHARVRAREEEYRVQNKHLKMSHSLMHKYGIILDDYVQMAEEQDYRCAVCRVKGEWQPGKGKKADRLVVDHCHKTGKVRGLLCNPCNHALGQLKDDVHNVVRAANYLLKHQ